MRSGRHSSGTTHGSTAFRVLALAACAAIVAAGAQAASVTHTFNYVTIGGQGQATASVTFDDSLLAPNTNTGFTCDLSLLVSFNMTVTGLPTSPSTTSFTKADVVAWIVTTDGSGRLEDINFFMGTLNQNCGAPKTNADGYWLDGIEQFTITISKNNQAGAPVELATFQEQHLPVPALSTYGTAALALLILLSGALLARRLW